MRIACPSCGVTGSLELFMADAEWREAVLKAAALPSDCGALAMRYVGMFRAQHRTLTPDRATRLIIDVHTMITDGTEFDRQPIKAPTHVWRDAILDLLDAPNVQRPLKNHNYLLRIMQSKLNQQADQQQHDRAEIRRSEQAVVRSGKMQSMRDAMGNSAQRLPDIPSEEREKRLIDARDLLLSDGFKPAFLGTHLIEQKAREIYAAEVADGV